jgi:large exoprotein involved in heme utilization and adhesion
VAGKAGDTASTVAGKAGKTASTVAGKAGSAATSVRAAVRDADLPAQARKPLPWAVVAGLAATITVIIYAVRRRRA